MFNVLMFNTSGSESFDIKPHKVDFLTRAKSNMEQKDTPL